MKKIINNLKTLLSSKQQTNNLQDCNFSDNYYGDQICLTTPKLHVDDI